MHTHWEFVLCAPCFYWLFSCFTFSMALRRSGVRLPLSPPVEKVRIALIVDEILPFATFVERLWPDALIDLDAVAMG